VSEDGEHAPWCETAQNLLVGFKNQEDADKMDIISVFKTKSHAFEDTRVGYSPEENEHVLFNISGYNKYYGNGTLSVTESCYTPAKELGCKMASADRVAEQLKLAEGTYDDTLRCKDVNKKAFDYAMELLGQTPSG